MKMKKFKIGSDVVIKGKVNYFQDHSMWRAD